MGQGSGVRGRRSGAAIDNRFWVIGIVLVLLLISHH